jgi:hypothetical protein
MFYEQHMAVHYVRAKMFFFGEEAERLEQGERSDWSRRNRATRSGGAKQLEQGERSD